MSVSEAVFWTLFGTFEAIGIGCFLLALSLTVRKHKRAKYSQYQCKGEAK